MFCHFSFIFSDVVFMRFGVSFGVHIFLFARERQDGFLHAKARLVMRAGDIPEHHFDSLKTPTQSHHAAHTLVYARQPARDWMA